MDFTNKKTKIVATIGPATEKLETLTQLAKSGMNVVRLNFSHGDFNEHQPRVDNTRLVSKKLNLPLAILQDLSGPKIRIGSFDTEKVTLKAGNKFTLTTREIVGNENECWVSYSRLPVEVKPGNIILLRDGRVKLEVNKTTKTDITCTVIVGGELTAKKGVNVPGAYLTIDCLTEKDREDLKFGIKNKVDYMALSFVRKASDIIELKEILTKAKADIKVIAKIETPEAIENIDAIIQETHGIMVARGDLAVEMPPEQVPILQKMIVNKCKAAGKPVIVATQMLESMISNPLPTRAEVNDIANAILDGADAVMLSEETTLGKHPIQAVEMMSKIAQHTEMHYPYEEILRREHLASTKNGTDSVCFAAANLAHDLNASCIVALTVSGFTARMISRYRSKRPVLVLTPEEKTYNRTALKFNCYPVLTKNFTNLDQTIEEAKRLAVKQGFAKPGNTIIIVAGLPFSQPGNTNLVLAQKI